MRTQLPDPPQDTVAEQQPVVIRHRTNGGKVIAIHQRSDVTESREQRRLDNNHLKPVIDFTGKLNKFADLSLNERDKNISTKIEVITNAFAARSDRVAATAPHRTNDEHRFLAYLYVSDQPFRLAYDPSQKENIAYNPFAPVKDALALAKRLYKKKLVSRKFFDRFHQCGSCGSSRLNVREECMSCRSADIDEVALIHHFTCGYQGAESDFTQGRDLVCPKCKKHLTHYGSDYEKSGIVMDCHQCGDANSAASVGFVCLDCESHQDSETMQTVTHYSYDITREGISHLMNGSEPGNETRDLLQAMGLPFAIIREIMALRLGISESRSRESASFVLIELSYLREKEIVSQLGQEAFEKLRNQIHHNLRAIIRENDLFEQGPVYDYLILKETDRETLFDQRSTFLARCQHKIKHDLGIHIKCFDGEELSFQ